MCPGTRRHGRCLRVVDRCRWTLPSRPFLFKNSAAAAVRSRFPLVRKPGPTSVARLSGRYSANQSFISKNHGRPPLLQQPAMMMISIYYRSIRGRWSLEEGRPSCPLCRDFARQSRPIITCRNVDISQTRLLTRCQKTFINRILIEFSVPIVFGASRQP